MATVGVKGLNKFVFMFDVFAVRPVHNQNHFVSESANQPISRSCENLLIHCYWL